MIFTRNTTRYIHNILWLCTSCSLVIKASYAASVEKQNNRGFFYQCSDDQCDFYLDCTCRTYFIKRPELLGKYEIQHFLHLHENHQLSPYARMIDYEYFESDDEVNEICHNSPTCAACTYSFKARSGRYKCKACPFYLHTECSQVPKEVVNHHSHPHHPLVLLQNPPPPAADHHHDSVNDIRCTTCLKRIKCEFYLHRNHCPTFNLDLDCYFGFKPTLKHEAHEHPLAYFRRIYDDDVRCYACNTPCDYRSFRCFSCNFNIHHECASLPNTVDDEDHHVHPLALTTLFKEDENPTAYYCDICEERRDPNRGIYFCKECKFIAHFECALSLSEAEEEEHALAPWHQKKEEDNHRSDEEEDMILTDENVSREIINQLHVEIEKLEEVIQQLTIKKKRRRTADRKDSEFRERHTNTEDMLRRLKQSVIGTKINMPMQ